MTKIRTFLRRFFEFLCGLITKMIKIVQNDENGVDTREHLV